MARISDSFPKALTALVVSLSLVMIGALLLHTVETNNDLQKLQAEHVPALENIGIIVRLDEKSSSALRLYVSTGEKKWKDRYEELAPVLNETIAELCLKAHVDEAKHDEILINRDRVFAIEEEILAIAEKSGIAKAQKLLANSSLESTHQRFQSSVFEASELVNQSRESFLAENTAHARTLYLLVVILFPLLGLSWLFLGLIFRKNLRQTRAAYHEAIRQEKAANETRAFIENVFLSLSEMVFVIEEDAGIRKFNRSALDLLGFSKEEILGKKLSDLVENADPGAISLFEELGHLDKIDSRKVVLLGKNGERVTSLLSGIRLSSDEAEAPKSYVLTATDIREQIKLQESSLQNERLASIGELAAGVGHEINNPLAIAMGFLEKAKRSSQEKGLSRTDLENYLDRQHKALSRIRTIVQGLRRYSKVEADVFETIDLHVVIAEAVELLGEMYSKEGVAIEIDLDAENPRINGNIGRIQQALMNLFSNAKDAMEHTEQKRILIRTENHGPNLRLIFTDSGAGIEKSKLPRIFDAFFTTKTLGKGTGMGLGIMSKIIKEMDGTISVDSKVNEGTSFTLQFPSCQANADLNEKQSLQESLENDTIGGLALVVDDEEDLREILREELEELGLDVEEAEDGDIALEMVKAKDYDFVFSDIKMPRMQGDVFISEAKKVLNNSCKYFVVTGGVTTNYEKGNTVDIEALVDGYLMKPYSQEMLIDVIYKSLSKKRKAA